MRRALPLFCAALLGAACGPAPKPPPPPDAGPDTSCGIDCAAQRRYGLLVNRCFEYSASQQPATPADLGVWVTKTFDLEGGIKTLEVEYRQSGQVKMTDYFMLVGGDLKLARRAFLPGQSVTYKDGAGTIIGVTWLKASTVAGENFTSSAQADVTGVGPRHSDDTSYGVNTFPATTSEQTVPLQKFDDAFKVLLSESPNHGVDPRRIFAPGQGFVLFSTYFAPTTAGAPSEYRLQKIRDIGQADGGSVECGFGNP